MGWRGRPEKPTVEQLLHKLLHQGAHMSQQLDNLTAQVAVVKSVAQSAVSLIQSLKQNANPAVLDALSADLKSATDALAAEVNA